MQSLTDLTGQRQGLALPTLELRKTKNKNNGWSDLVWSGRLTGRVATHGGV